MAGFIAALFSGAWVHGAFGPSSQGFLPSCSSVFSVTNYMKQSGNFSSPWTLGFTGTATAPTLTANNRTAPDGTLTAAKLVIPAVSGSGSSSVIFQSFTTSGYNYSQSVWMKGEAGGEVVTFHVTPDGVTFFKTQVTLTTSWQQVNLLNWHSTGATWFVEIGVDLRIPGSPGSNSGGTIDIWHPQVNDLGQVFNYIPTTTTTVTQNQRVNCPPGVAFRDFSTLTYNSSVGSPAGHVWAQNTGTWNSGGVSNPYQYPWDKIGSTFYSLANCTVAGGSRGNWPGLCLYTGDGIYSWTDQSLSNPVVSAQSGHWDDHYLLHPATSPDMTGGVIRKYYSAMNSSGASAIGLLTSTNGLTYTKSASNPVIPAGSVHPSLPAIVQIGSTVHMYTSQNDNTGLFTLRWTSPVGDGVNWTLDGKAMVAPLSTDWDFGCDGLIDSYVFKNSHGFYEMFYTAFAFTSFTYQRIGYAVSADGINWWKRQDAPIITETSMSTPNIGNYIGDVVVYQLAGTFYVTMTYDNGTDTAFGFVATMTDH